MLKALLCRECLPTATTEKPEAAAESNAKVIPSMPFADTKANIKVNAQFREFCMNLFLRAMNDF
jgi:hypothetical protein